MLQNKLFLKEYEYLNLSLSYSLNKDLFSKNVINELETSILQSITYLKNLENKFSGLVINYLEKRIYGFVKEFIWILCLSK